MTRETTQIWVVILIGRAVWEICFRVVIRHQYGISSFVSLTSFRGETSGDVAKYRLFTQATKKRKKK